MARFSTLEVLNDTSLFDSRQLLPRTVLACSMRMWVRWAKDHLRAFPCLIQDYNFGVVVVRQSIRYERPFNFFSGDAFALRGTLAVRHKRRLLFGQVDFMHGDERVAYLECTMRPLAIERGADLGAAPADVGPPVLDMFLPDEIVEGPVARHLPGLLMGLADKLPVATAMQPIRIGRHESEAADQWSFIEVGAHAANAREAMILDAEPGVRKLLQQGLALPLHAIDLEISRPLFLFDMAEIHTTAYRTADSLTFVHIYTSNVGGSHQHATVMERFAL